MNSNANVIFTLCSHLCVGDGVLPLEPKEWGELARKLMRANLKPEDLFGLSFDDLKTKLQAEDDYAKRILKLLERNASLTFELGKLENIGISVVTRADKEYPGKLKTVLRNNCPPIFYVAGDLSLLSRKYVGYVGSRTVSEDDVTFAKNTVSKTAKLGFGVVSGGAKGIDSASEEKALDLGIPVVEYLSDSMLKKVRKSSILKAIGNKKMLLLSVVKPDAGFNVGVAMMRNRYIYAQSSGTVIVRSEYDKGGTWTGATENLKHGWCKEFCWNKKSYPGNKALIERGAIPIDENWDGDVEKPEYAVSNHVETQLSLFD